MKLKSIKHSFLLKGLIVGFIFGLAIYFNFFFTDSNSIAWFFGYTPFCSFFGNSDECYYGAFFFGWIIFPVIYGLIGALIGFFIDKFKQRKK